MIYVFLGIQGSGKGTQAKLLSNLLDLEHISLGEKFRKEIGKQTKLGKSVREYISKGILVPDDIVLELIKGQFAVRGNGCVFDGFPRTISQAAFLVEKYEVDRVLYLDLDDSIARERMRARRICDKCKRDYNLLFNPPHVTDTCDICNGHISPRADDKEELIQKRLDLFHQETKALIDFFIKKNLLSRVNAIGETQLIHKKILKEIILNS
ncbi:MAG: nucleoside monophosphate kinase [Candidatus Cloacimonetes bacterium]|nr:nucleoside monophosphate kinase [Candidatus Cloacimonadota bacterium]